MKRARILVVDDEPDLLELVRHHLTREHYDVVTAKDGESALRQTQRDIPDMVVLDLMLPGIDGLEVCRRLRADERTSHVPILLLTAKGEETDVVIGLSSGADDYVRKPFGIKELVARVGARLRESRTREKTETKRVLRFGELIVDSIKHEVTLEGAPIKLTVTEFKLLQHLVAHPGRAFTRSALLDAMVGADTVVIDRNVDVHVATLRKKLGAYGRHILTLRGVGYKLRESPEAPDT